MGSAKRWPKIQNNDSANPRLTPSETVGWLEALRGPHAQPTPGGLQCFPALDGLRGVAIAMVVFWHYYACAPRPDWVMHVPLLETLAGYGWCGVPLFFVLSGFLIGRILTHHRGDTEYYRAFFIRRACRILPLYFLSLAGFSVAAFFLSETTHPYFGRLLDTSPPYWVYTVFLQNMTMAGTGNFGGAWLGVTWSVAVEVQFYILIPFLVAVLPQRLLLRVLLGLVLLAIAFRWIALGLRLGQPRALIVLLPARMDGFAIGILVGMMLNKLPAGRWIRWALLATFIALAGAIHFGRTTIGNVAYLAILYTLISACFATAMVYALHTSHGCFSRCLSWRPLRWLGGISYCIYLFHEIVNGFLHGFFLQQQPTLASPLSGAMTLGSLVLVCVIGELSRRYIEAPFIRLGRRYQYATSVTSAAEPTPSPA